MILFFDRLKNESFKAVFILVTGSLIQWLCPRASLQLGPARYTPAFHLLYIVYLVPLSRIFIKPNTIRYCAVQ